ncbi:hypothetical protein BO94DRAFT_543146 [Aspergillus sclerotioniger CBS 115572]|uniref:Uncharacterized protein n=1 Tax=Aspergillus sclerotioniger CBS 115572 TaxID=1450535 RepID=A0A317XBC8_9EURO|nr:hypothetical protein BO94DRAFT_543146 [Aspergillus sclerotioniger CBS 115572]PWY93850.1 hypothetical protein BO94DRAFT_543146 [Aspergillus sclerotioniger CBS 115572]
MAPNPLGLSREDPHPPSPVEKTVFDLLCTYLPPDSSLTAIEAAKQLHDAFPSTPPKPRDDDELYRPETLKQFLFELWEMMFRIVPQLHWRGEPMQRFISLLQAMESLPKIPVKDEDQETGYKEWSLHGYFICGLDERWRQISAPEELGDKCDLKLRNFNGLLANFTNCGIYTPWDYEALLSMMSLETHQRIGHKVLLNSTIPTATVWFILSAPAIYTACQERTCADKKRTRGRLWKADQLQGFSIPRWKFWRRRLEEVKSHADGTEEFRTLCQEAMDAMDRCEEA